MPAARSFPCTFHKDRLILLVVGLRDRNVVPVVGPRRLLTREERSIMVSPGLLDRSVGVAYSYVLYKMWSRKLRDGSILP